MEKKQFPLAREHLGTNAEEHLAEFELSNIEAGALGGKLLGAGGGGFMLFFARPEIQPAIRRKLSKLVYVPFNFHDLGSQIVYYAPEQNY